MAYINGNEILFSAIVNSGSGDGDVNLDDVSVSNVAVNTAIAGGATGAGKGTILSVKLNAGDETRSVNYGMTTDPITADVIKKGTNILGVTGTLETVSGGIELDDVSVSNVAVNTTLMGGVTVSVKGKYLDVSLTDGEKTKSTLYSVTTDPIVPEVIKKGTNILGVTGTLEAGSGGIELDDVRVVNSSVYVLSSMPTYLNYQLTDGTNTTEANIIMADTDPITPDVIKKGTTILGVEGTLEAGSSGGDISLDAITVSTVAVINSSGGAELRIVFTDGENIKFVTYAMPTAPITADVIKKGVNVLGVTGTYEGEAGRDIVDVSITEV